MITTGVLLMDQRFWGQRLHEMGIGPPPIHISNFHSCCVDYVNQALHPESPWRSQAKKVAIEIIAYLQVSGFARDPAKA